MAPTLLSTEVPSEMLHFPLQGHHCSSTKLLNPHSRWGIDTTQCQARCRNWLQVLGKNNQKKQKPQPCRFFTTVPHNAPGPTGKDCLLYSSCPRSKPYRCAGCSVTTYAVSDPLPTPTPTRHPTSNPTRGPTPSPTQRPSVRPTLAPTTAHPSTMRPTTFEPTRLPTLEPSASPTGKQLVPDWADRTARSFKCKGQQQAANRVMPQLKNVTDYTLLIWFRSNKYRPGLNTLVDFSRTPADQDLAAFVETYARGINGDRQPVQYVSARQPFVGIRIRASGLADDEWHQFAVVRHADNRAISTGNKRRKPVMRAYLDGMFRRHSYIMESGGLMFSDFTVATIGSNSGNQGHFCGSVGTVLVFRRALNSTEIQTLWTDKPSS